MAESMPTRSDNSDATRIHSGSDMPESPAEPRHRAAMTPWLSIVAVALALAALGLTLFDSPRPPSRSAGKPAALTNVLPAGDQTSTSQLVTPQSVPYQKVASQSGTTQPTASGVAASQLARAQSIQSQSAAARAADAGDGAAGGRPSAASTSRVRLVETQVELPLDGLRQEAEKVALRLEQQLPDKPQSLHVAALFYAQTRQTVEAQKRWQRCIELSPQVEMYYINLAALSMERGDNELAIQTLEQALDAEFDSPALMHHWALALSNAGRFEEAIPVIEKTLADDPNNSAEWLMLGKAQMETGALEQAEKSLLSAMDLGMKTAGVYFALGNTYARQGKREQAKEFLKLYEENRPNKNDSTQERLEGLNLSEMRQTAVLVLSEAANVYLQVDETLEAERLLLRTLAIDTRALGPARVLAEVYFDKKMLPEERLVRERILQIDPYNFGNYVDCAKVYAQLDDMAAAEAVLKQAMTQRPDAVEPYATLAEFYWQAKSLPEARWAAQHAVEQQPRPEGYRLLAAICEAQKDAEGYRQAIEQAARLSKPQP